MLTNGLSATSTPANNLRGINAAVSSTATTLAVTFTVAEPDANYGTWCCPNWNTTWWVTGKSTTGFTINFGTAAPAAQTADWMIVR